MDQRPTRVELWELSPPFQGQKLRLALARAVYSDKRVFLLDDPFAALDRAVARFVYDRCVRGMLLGRGKLVLLCTHHEQFLREADLVIRLNAGGEPELIGEQRIDQINEKD